MAVSFTSYTRNLFEAYMREQIAQEVKPWVVAEEARREVRRAQGNQTFYRPDLGPYRMLDAEEVHRYEQMDMIAPRRAQPYRSYIRDEEMDVRGVDELTPTMMNVELRTVEMSRAPMPNMRRTDRATADRWVQFAAAEAQSHAAICKPSGCTCPNCDEYQRIRRRALELMDLGHVDRLTEAWHMALDEMTGGAEEPFRPIAAAPTPRAAPPSTMFPTPPVVVVNTPSTDDASWVQKRFGVIDV